MKEVNIFLFALLGFLFFNFLRAADFKNKYFRSRVELDKTIDSSLTKLVNDTKNDIVTANRTSEPKRSMILEGSRFFVHATIGDLLEKNDELQQLDDQMNKLLSEQSHKL